MMGTVGTLNAGDKHLLLLAQRDKDAEGWCRVSKQVWPLLKGIPPEFVELRPSDDGGHIRLTEVGDTYVNWM